MFKKEVDEVIYLRHNAVLTVHLKMYFISNVK